MPLPDHFDLIAPFYDRAIHYQRAQRMIELLGLPMQGAVLDAGGGTGRVAQALSGFASKVIVADVSLGMLRQARAKNGLGTVCAPSEKLPFSDASFERIIMVDALHHVHHQAHTARELWRVLKPGRRLVIEEPDVRDFGVKLIALAEKLLLMRSHFLAPADIASLFPYPSARTRVEVEGSIAWVMVEKDGAA